MKNLLLIFFLNYYSNLEESKRNKLLEDLSSNSCFSFIVNHFSESVVLELIKLDKSELLKLIYWLKGKNEGFISEFLDYYSGLEKGDRNELLKDLPSKSYFSESELIKLIKLDKNEREGIVDLVGVAKHAIRSEFLIYYFESEKNVRNKIIEDLKQNKDDLFKVVTDKFTDVSNGITFEKATVLKLYISGYSFESIKEILKLTPEERQSIVSNLNVTDYPVIEMKNQNN